MTEKKRILWIELLRITACLGVILLHMGSQFFRSVPINSYTWMVSNAYHGLSRFAVGCFIMISGTLYLDRGHKRSIKRIWTSSILPLASGYVFWQLFYAFYETIQAGTPVLSTVFLKNMILALTSPYFHLWYLPLLIEFLILTPILWEIVNCEKGKAYEEYLIVLFILFQIAKVTINHFPHSYNQALENLTNTVSPQLVTNYTGYYILGHYLSHYQLPRKLEKTIYVLGIVCITTGILLCRHYSMKTGSAIQSFYENYTFAAFFCSSAVFLFFKNHISALQWNPRAESIICRISGCTYGIFLIHVLIRDLLYDLGIHAMAFNELFSIPLLSLVIFVISCSIVFVLERIPVLKKWIL